MKIFELRFLIFEILLFFLCQILGILVARQFFSQGLISQVPLPGTFFQFLAFIFIFLFFTTIFLLIVFFLKHPKIFLKAIFSLAAFLGSQMALGAFLNQLLATILAIILVVFWHIFSNVSLHNFLLILSVAGIGGFLGPSLKPETVLLLFIFLSIYDIIAVYKTKHMVKIIKPMIESKTVFGLIVPSKLKNFFLPLKEVKVSNSKERFFLLGSGDLILPVIFSTSFAGESILKSGIVAFFTILGLIFGFFIFLKFEKRSMPGLPPLALGGILGYLFTQLL